MYTLYMALHITNPEIEQEVRNLARERGQSITEVVGAAIRNLRCRNDQAIKRKPSVEEMLALIHSFPRGPINYDLSDDEILGYGPNGY